MRAECEKHNTQAQDGSCSRKRRGTGAACVTLFDTLRTCGRVVPPRPLDKYSAQCRQLKGRQGTWQRGRSGTATGRREGGREGLAGGALRYHEKVRALYVHRLASELQHYRVVANRSEWKLKKNWGTSADVTARRGKKKKKTTSTSHNDPVWELPAFLTSRP